MGRMAGAAQRMAAILALVLAASTGVAGAGDRDPSAGDPWEPMNRGIFWFNDRLDVYLLEPVARGWRWIAPEPVRRGVRNFFDNVRFPIVFLNEMLQAKPADALRTAGRFTLNTTLGLGGFLDPASEFGLEATREDFGQTLGVWGVPAGPYLVLPFLGPSTLRDTGGLAVDAATAIYPWFADWLYLIGPRTLEAVNTRAQFLDEVAEAKAASLDYYAAVRNAYQQRRQADIEDRTDDAEGKGGPDEELYEIVDP